MNRFSGTFALAALLAAAPLAAQARPSHPAKPHASPAMTSRQAAMNGFTARMGRLDALMGQTSATRTRSASAEH